jgi:Ca2+-binding RTX toxin-like protein
VGRDTNFGQGGNDGRLDGDRGEDRAFGGAGRDELEGDQGDDLLDGGPGFDEAEGGLGNDACRRSSCDAAADRAVRPPWAEPGSR